MLFTKVLAVGAKVSNCELDVSFFIQEGKTPKECLREGYCKALQVSFFECKRSILDNRSRFRGRKGY
ncbi:hypothetical protein FKM82_008981 [Ascaphus truei]